MRILKYSKPNLAKKMMPNQKNTANVHDRDHVPRKEEDEEKERNVEKNAKEEAVTETVEEVLLPQEAGTEDDTRKININENIKININRNPEVKNAQEKGRDPLNRIKRRVMK